MDGGAEREIAISRDPEIVRRVCLECTRPPSRMDVVACPSVVISRQQLLAYFQFVFLARVKPTPFVPGLFVIIGKSVDD